MVEAVTAKRDDAMRQERDYTAAKLKMIFDSMRQKVKSRTLMPPTEAQQAVITSLRSRKTLTKQELEAAENTLAGCPLALSALDEIAADHGYGKVKPRPTAMPTPDALRHIDVLEGNTRHTLQGDGGVQFNRLPKDASYALVTWGGLGWNVVEDSIGGQHTVAPETVGRFSEAVDGE